MITSFNTYTVGSTNVLFNYEGIDGEYGIEVIEMDIVAITVNDVTKTYKRNSSWDGTVIYKFENGDSVTIPITEDMISGWYTSTEDTTIPITVSYAGCDFIYNINVIEMDITGIAVAGVQTEYTRKDAFSEMGSIIVTYEDNSTRVLPIKSTMVQHFDTTMVTDELTVIISYSG